MKKLLIFTVMLLGMCGMAFSQGMGEIRGRVTDEKTGETIPGVNVVVKVGSSIIGVQSDVKGNFVLKPLHPGTYSVEFSFMGYKTHIITSVSVQSERITALNEVGLVQGTIDIDGPVITGYTVPLITPEPKIVMEAKDLKNMAGKDDLKKIISNITPEAYSTDNGALYFRGARDNDFVYYVDGMKQMGGNVNVPTVAIGSIQVYTGGVPARYGDFTGGCIVIETQSYFDWLNSRR